MRYFVGPLLGTPYTRYFHLEGSTVVLIDISRPDGTEVPCPVGVKFKVRKQTYERHKTYTETHAPTNNAEWTARKSAARLRRVEREAAKYTRKTKAEGDQSSPVQ